MLLVSHSRFPVWDNPLHDRSGRVMEPADRQGKCLHRATRSQIGLLGLMHGTQELAATSFLRVTLVPIIDLDVIQFAAETVTAATSAPAPDPCRSLAPTRRRKTSAPHPSAGGHLRELTSCAGTNLDPCGHRVQPQQRHPMHLQHPQKNLAKGHSAACPHAEAFLPVARLDYS